ncbi:MAG: hypothetical protein OES09_03245 [Gammaproteobacteria bacterium]|nr:hypothetical protein [Gammaproteobacteria bacterium]
MIMGEFHVFGFGMGWFGWGLIIGFWVVIIAAIVADARIDLRRSRY